MQGRWLADFGNNDPNSPDPSTRLALSFDEPLEDDPAKAPLPSPSDFTLSRGGSPLTDTGGAEVVFTTIEVRGSAVALVTNVRVTTAMAGNNNKATLTYTPGDYPLRDRDGNAVAQFDLEVFRQAGGQPQINSARVNGEIITLAISSAIDPISVPPASAFTLYYADGMSYPNSVSRVVPSHYLRAEPKHRVELHLAFPVPPCAGATPFGVSYVHAPGGPILQAMGGWGAKQRFEPVSVTNDLNSRCARGQAPAVRDNPQDSRGGRPRSVTLDFDRTLDTEKMLKAADFQARSQGASGQPALSVQQASFTTDGQGVTLTLSRSLEAGETAGLGYAFPRSGEGLWDAQGNQIGSFTGVEVRGPRLPALSAADAAGDEGGALTFTVTLDQASDAEVTVDYATADGTATAGEDYTATSGTLTFAAGETEQTVEVALLHDVAADDGETLALTLSNPSAGATIADAEATGTVSDVAPLTAAFEGLPAEHDGAEAFAFEIVFGEEFAGLDLTAFQNGALEIGNGEFVSAALTTAGQNRRVTVRVRPSSVDDVTLALPAVTDCSLAGAVCATGGRMLSGAAAVTVIGPVAVLVSDAEISEDSQFPTVEFPVKLNRAGGEDVYFDYATSDGTATAGEDYTATSGTWRIPAGSTRKFWVTVVVHNDDIREGSETFTLTLSNVRGAAVGRSEATGTITEPEIPPVVSVADATANEGATLSFAVTLDVAPTADVTVDYATSNGTATAGTDYTAATGTLTFAVGETEKTVEVALLHDIAADDAETLTLTLSNPSGATLGDGQATGTITNVAPPALSVADGTAGEGGTLSFTVTLDQASDAQVTVDYATADGTATAGTDYTAATGTLTFAAGETEKTVEVALLHDIAADDGETLNLTLSNPSGATIADAEATGTVSDVAPLTAAFEGLPAEHDGAEAFAFEIVFGEEFAGLDLTAFQNGALEIGNGEFVSAALTTAGQNRRVTVRVRPSSVDDVTLALPAVTDCSLAGAVCATGGRMLSGAAAVTVIGPVAVLVSDAEISEDAEFASVEFPVKLNRASGEDVYFDYATSDGTATAGEDYTAASGTSRIPAGSTRKFWVTVTVHNDDVREGNETFTLTLSNVRGAALGRGQATGTITEPVVLPIFSVADATADEGGTLAFAVTLDVAATAEVTVDYATSDGTATAGTDYTAASGTLTFAAGETSKTVSVASLTDTAAEGDETFTLTLSNPSTGATLGDAEATGTITEPQALPALNVDDATANEGTALVFTVTLDKAAKAQVSVDYATSDGTATAGTDYRTASGTLTFAAGVTTKTVSVSALTDAAAEAAETFMLRLSNPSGATLSDGQATGTVAEVAAATPVLSVADATADEGAALSFAVTLDVAPTADVTVDYATANGTATAGTDYTATSGTLTFTAGETSKTVSVPAQHDTAAESDETFTLTLSNPSGATLGDGQATGTIADVAPLTAAFEQLPESHNGKRLFGFEVVFSEEFKGLRLTAFAAGALEVTGGRLVDAKRVTRGENRRVAVRVRPSSDGDMTLRLLATTDCSAASAICAAGGRMLSNTASATVTGPGSQVRISAADAQASEGGTLSFTITLDKAATADVSVDYATSDGTATAGTDYRTASGTLTFAAEETSKTVSVPALSDTATESDETFTLTLSNPSGATLGVGQATGTISNVAPPPALNVADATADEGAALSFTITLDRASDAEVSVDYATSDGTATAGTDYTAASGTLTFTAGQTSKTVSVSALSDTASEASETFTLTLSNPSGATIADAAATGTITNVPPPPALSIADATADEGARLAFTVTLDRAATADVTVDYATSDGTATAGEDYTATSGTLTLTAGETSKSVSVPARHDTAAESDETFTLTLSNPSGATLGDGEATGTIAEVAPLTAAFEGLPDSHNGKRLFGFEIVFSEEFQGFRLTALEAGALEVTGGRLVDAKRVTRGENQRVAVRVRPSSDGDMTLRLLATTDCAAATAICATGGRMLSNTVSATVPGPGGGS